METRTRSIMECDETYRMLLDEMSKGPRVPNLPSIGPSAPKLPLGLPQMPGRSYSPGLARFLTQVRLEELIGGEHPYGYAQNNPVTYTDPSGLKPQGIGQWIRDELTFNYGSYCGGNRTPFHDIPKGWLCLPIFPGVPLPIIPPLPFDALDRCCMAHDAAYIGPKCVPLIDPRAECVAADNALCLCGLDGYFGH